MANLNECVKVFFENKIDKDNSDIDCLERALSKFCKTGTKADAFSVYYCFCEIFKVFGSGYGSMNRLIEFLYDHENHSGELLTKHRDHYSHSVYVFALGLAIYANDKVYRKTFLDFYKDEGGDATSFLRWWGLAALFHDIGYPFQLAYEQIKAYGQSLWGENSPDAPHVGYENMDKLLSLTDKMKSDSPFFAVQTVVEVLAYGIHERLGYPVHTLLLLLNRRYKNQSMFMDHGYFSALLLLNKLSCVEMPFTAPISDVLTAIALHNNLNRFDIKSALGTDTAIPAKKHPLAYLLILCDEMQDWDRTAFGYISKKDPLAWTVDLSITNGKIDICYVFDSDKVTDTQECKDGENICGSVIKEIERDNKNYVKFASGKFVNGLSALVDGDTKVNVTTRLEKKTKKVNSFVSSDSFINLCDFARAIHKSYQSLYGGKDFDELSLEFRLSNIEQAKSYADKLELINCFYSDKELDYPIVTGFTDGDRKKDLEFLAREEHLRWVREKLDAGWKYGKLGVDYTKENRNEKKRHEDLVPFDFLPQKEKDKDSLMIKNMVSFLYHFGHGVRIYNYRGGRKPVLDIAGCGHRTVSMHDKKIKEQIKAILREYQKDYLVRVRTNFAYGADQLIAECAIELGITIKATLPLPYEQYIEAVRNDAKKYRYTFTADDEDRMRCLLAQAVTCNVQADENGTYLAASKFIISESKKLIALWDGVQTVLEDKDGNPINQGGTWHNIFIAQNSRGMKMGEDIHIIHCDR